MNPRVLFPIVEIVSDDPLAVAIREEVDRAGGDGTNECWSKTFEECTKGFFTVHVPGSGTFLSALVGTQQNIGGQTE